MNVRVLEVSAKGRGKVSRELQMENLWEPFYRPPAPHNDKQRSITSHGVDAA